MSVKSAVSAGITAAATMIIASLVSPTAAAAAPPRAAVVSHLRSIRVTVDTDLRLMHRNCGFCGLFG